MTQALENLCGPGKALKAEPPDANEFAGLLRTGIARLKDARNTSLALESRFDLAYNAAHALSLPRCGAPVIDPPTATSSSRFCHTHWL